MSSEYCSVKNDKSAAWNSKKTFIPQQHALKGIVPNSKPSPPIRDGLPSHILRNNFRGSGFELTSSQYQSSYDVISNILNDKSSSELSNEQIQNVKEWFVRVGSEKNVPSCVVNKVSDITGERAPHVAYKTYEDFYLATVYDQGIDTLTILIKKDASKYKIKKTLNNNRSKSPMMKFKEQLSINEKSNTRHEVHKRQPVTLTNDSDTTVPKKNCKKDDHHFDFSDQVRGAGWFSDLVDKGKSLARTVISNAPKAVNTYLQTGSIAQTARTALGRAQGFMVDDEPIDVPQDVRLSVRQVIGNLKNSSGEQYEIVSLNGFSAHINGQDYPLCSIRYGNQYLWAEIDYERDYYETSFKEFNTQTELPKVNLDRFPLVFVCFQSKNEIKSRNIYELNCQLTELTSGCVLSCENNRLVLNRDTKTFLTQLNGIQPMHPDKLTPQLVSACFSDRSDVQTLMDLATFYYFYMHDVYQIVVRYYGKDFPNTSNLKLKWLSHLGLDDPCFAKKDDPLAFATKLDLIAESIRLFKSYPETSGNYQKPENPNNFDSYEEDTKNTRQAKSAYSQYNQ